MRGYGRAIAGVIASLVVVGGAGAALAQGRAAPRGQVIEVPPGATVIVLPGGMVPAMPSWSAPAFDAALPTPAMPDAATLWRQVDEMLANAQRAFAAPVFTDPAWATPDRVIEAAMRHASGPVSGVLVTSFSDGQRTCTRRVTYSGDAASPRVQVNATGNACANEQTPAALPAMRPSPRATPRTLEVNDRTWSAPVARAVAWHPYGQNARQW